MACQFFVVWRGTEIARRLLRAKRATKGPHPCFFFCDKEGTQHEIAAKRPGGLICHINAGRVQGSCALLYRTVLYLVRAFDSVDSSHGTKYTYDSRAL